MKKIVVIPTYNEKEAITPILMEVIEKYPDFHIMVVDDNSPDGTAGIVSALAQKHPHLSLISRPGKQGLGAAYKDVLSRIKKMSDVEAVVTVDADGSHDPSYIQALLRALATADVSVGSRYVRGGGVVGWSFWRLLLSFGGNFYVNVITGIPVRDSTAGFVAFRKSTLDAIDIDAIPSTGYAYQIEFKNAVLAAGKKITEVPIQFVERKVGNSKISRAIVLEGIRAPWHILFRMLSRGSFPHWWKAAAVIALFMFAAFFALFRLSESPSVWYDEGIYTQMAMNLSDHGVVGFQLSPGEITHISRVTVGYPLVVPLALTMKVFGTDILVSRGLMVAFLLGLLALAYLLMKKEFGYTTALGTLALLATFPPLYGNGKSVLGEVPGLFFFVLALWCLYQASAHVQRSRWALLAGVSLGLCAATKPLFLVSLGAFAIALLMMRRSTSWSVRDIGFALLGVVLSLGIWFGMQFSTGDSLSATLAFYANPYQTTSLVTTILANVKNLVTGATPLYLLFLMGIWSVSLVIRRVKKEHIALSERTAFLTAVLIIVAYLRIVGWYRYLFPAQIIALLYTVSSLVVIVRELRSRVSLRAEAFLRPLAVGGVMLLSIVGIYGLSSNSWVAEYYGSHKTVFWEQYFKTAPAQESFFFYDVPEVARFAYGRAYYQYIAPAGGPFSTKELDAIEQGLVDTIIVRTDTYESEISLFSKHYRSTGEYYKYSVLEKQKPLP